MEVPGSEHRELGQDGHQCGSSVRELAPGIPGLTRPRLLERAGLTDVRTAHRTVSARFANPQQWVDFSWSHGQRTMWECVPLDQRDQALRQAREMLESWQPLAWTPDVRHTLGRKPENAW